MVHQTATNMARPKKTEVSVTEGVTEASVTDTTNPEVIVHTGGALIDVIPTLIEKLSVDYTNEGLNNMAKKINEIIEHLNG